MNEYLAEKLLRVRQQADLLIERAAELFEEVEVGSERRQEHE